MRHDTPLRNRHQTWLAEESDRIESQVASADRPGSATAARSGSLEIEYLPYGPGDEEGAPTCEIVSTFGAVEPEYAAIRRGVGVLDAPHRAIIEVKGEDRLAFLDSMLTQGLGALAPGELRRSFWLRRTGRIVSDLVVANFEDRCLLETDVHVAEETAETLEMFHFAEDVEIIWAPDAWTQLRLYGPASLAALGELLQEGAPPTDDSATEGVLNGVAVSMLRTDETGEPGVILVMRRSDAEQVWDVLFQWSGSSKLRMRPIGWSAFNTARIEAGAPLFNIDFGPDALPQETGVFSDRVSVQKGCYLGQEIVARLESLGNPKQLLVALDLDKELLPVAGSQIFASVTGQDGEEGLGPQVGWVSSSTPSPMLGGRPVVFAIVRFEHASSGTKLLLTAEGEQLSGVVRDQLSFLPGVSS